MIGKARRWLVALWNNECCGEPRCRRSDAPYWGRHPGGALWAIICCAGIATGLSLLAVLYADWVGTDRRQAVAAMSGSAAVVAALFGLVHSLATTVRGVRQKRRRTNL